MARITTAREPIDVLKQQLGNLLAEVAFLTSELEKTKEALEALAPKKVENE
jgi:hypothetical protein